MNVMFISPYTSGPSAARFIQESFISGFRHEGYRCRAIDARRLPDHDFQDEPPAIIWCDVVCSPFEDDWFLKALRKAKNSGAKIVLWLYWPLSDLPLARTQAIKDNDVVDVCIGEREVDSMQHFIEDTGFAYYTIPMSANSSAHRVVPFNEDYAYDIAFVGAKLPKKRWFNEQIIVPLRKKYRVAVFGSNWTVADNFKRAASKVLRMSNLPNVAANIDKTRFSISEEDELSLYSSAKICLNFHEREADLTQPHHIVNFRTFKIPACGGFQICDDVKNMRQYFGEDELVTIECDRSKWFQQIEHYLHAPDERKQFVAKAYQRVRNEHMDYHRVRTLETLLGLRNE